MDKEAGLSRLSENLYLLPGSPNTVIAVDEIANRAVIVDPGIGEDRAEAIMLSVSKLGFSEAAIILTHAHTDHLAAAVGLVQKGWGPLYAPRLCITLVEDTVARRALVFGGLVSKSLASLPMQRLRVDYYFVDGNPLPGGFKAISLPGHSPGHSGLLSSEDGVAIVGDAVLGEKVLEKYGIPFGIDLRVMLDTIESRLRELVEEGYRLVLGHGPIVEGRRAQALLEANAKAIKRAREVLLELLRRKPVTVEKASLILTKELSSAELTPRQILLNKTAVQSILAWLEEDGLVEPVVGDEGVIWRARV
ncbi:MAG: MBL fold metallo-hydrolase [Pyrodictiaceae archaeon]